MGSGETRWVTGLYETPEEAGRAYKTSRLNTGMTRVTSISS